MNRQLTALFAALEALLVVAIGVAIPLVPLTLLWGIQYGLSIEWTVFWRASADIWLVGHGVDVTFMLIPETANSFGLAGGDAPVLVSIALLGFSLLTILLGVRAGRRVAETRYRVMGGLVSLATFALASTGVVFSARHPSAEPSIVQGIVLPTVVFAVGAAIGLLRSSDTEAAATPIRAWLRARPPELRAGLITALRGGAAAAATVMLAAALLTAGALAVSYARIISLYESLHTEVLGGFAVTLGQLALLPNLVIWTASWLVGPGFAIGTGSAVSPLGVTLGPLPALPILGALPSGELAFGFVGLVVPVIAGFLAGAILAPRERARLTGSAVPLAALGMGIVGGIILGLLAWASAGAAGPGRLIDVGPGPWAVGGWAALELAVGALIGSLASLRRSAR